MNCTPPTLYSTLSSLGRVVDKLNKWNEILTISNFSLSTKHSNSPILVWKLLALYKGIYNAFLPPGTLLPLTSWWPHKALIHHPIITPKFSYQYYPECLHNHSFGLTYRKAEDLQPISATQASPYLWGCSTVATMESCCHHPLTLQTSNPVAASLPTTLLHGRDQRLGSPRLPSHGPADLRFKLYLIWDLNFKALLTNVPSMWPYCLM